MFFGDKNIFQLWCAGYSSKIYVPFTYNFDFVSKNEFLPLPKEFDLTTNHVFKKFKIVTKFWINFCQAISPSSYVLQFSRSGKISAFATTLRVFYIPVLFYQLTYWLMVSHLCHKSSSKLGHRIPCSPLRILLLLPWAVSLEYEWSYNGA